MAKRHALPLFAQARIRKFSADAACGPRGEQGKIFPARFCGLEVKLYDNGI